jgi:HPt (histidine-containing phosphotransfer) domain-containing protein
MVNNSKKYGSSPGRGPWSKLNEEEVWVQLAVQYLRDLPAQLHGIRTTVKSKDYSTVKEQAHRIKGTSGTYRLDVISRSVAELEYLADSQNADAIVATIDKVMLLVEMETKRLNSRLVSATGSCERDANG